jgi:hypothetical protein
MTTFNMGIFSELANSKVDLDLRNVDLSKTDILIEYQEPTAANSFTWYRLYASGWVAQGGHINFTGSDYTATVVLPIIMADTNYNLTGGELSSVASNGYHSHIVVGYDKTITGFKSHIANTGQGKDWLVTGKANMAGHEILPTSSAAQAVSIQAFEHRIIGFQKPTAENSYRWYRLYADGWVEQGGVWAGTSSAPENGTIELPIAMANTNYQVLFSYNQNADSTSDWTANTSFRPLSTTQVKVRKLTSVSGNIAWEVKGLAA